MLSQAHRIQREAEKATKKGRIAEAIIKHKEAANILHGLLETIVSQKAEESLRVQARFHEKEHKLLEQYEQYRLAENLELLRVNMDAASEAASRVIAPADYRFGQLQQQQPRRGCSSSKARPIISQQQDNLQSSIYRAFNETETLIDRLRAEEGGGSGEERPRPSAVSAATGTKKPKDDKVIIEELEVANCHLRRMVDSLFVELDHCQRESLDLKERVRELEEQLRLGDLRQRASRSMQPPQMLLESSTTAATGRVEMELPVLPPLDVPTFDFDQ
jgi:hypothetical protein